jgi:hypothetical protein
MFTPQAQAQKHRENQEEKDPRTGPIMAADIAVHRHMGRGLLESAEERSLPELDLRGIDFRKFDVPLLTRGITGCVL